MYDIIVIGAGVAGLTSAIYGVRAGKKVLLIEGNYYGGQIVNAGVVENYPGISEITGFEFAQNLYKQATSLGAEFIQDFVQKVDVSNSQKPKKVYTTKAEYECHTLILATGLIKKHLGVKNEDLLIGKGVSYCATCDGGFYRGKKVAVNGGGNTALEDAIYLSDLSEEVILIHRRNGFRGEEHLLQRVKEKENIRIMTECTVESILGNDRVTGLELRHLKTDEIEEIQVDGIFIAIGQKPSNDIFSDAVSLDEQGYIVAAEDCKTNVEGVYAAGDCRTKIVRQLTTAASDGAVAAVSACEFMNVTVGL